MASVEELRKDLEEYEKFKKEATRQRVINFISVEISKLNTEVKLQLEKNENVSKPASGDGARPTSVYREKLLNYGWDQSDKFMKLYISLNEVQGIEKYNITSEYADKSVRLKIDGLKNKNYELYLGNLCENIDPSASYHKVKTDMVLVMLKKTTSGKTWSHVTAAEKKVTEKKTPTPDLDKEDPNASMMKLLQKMYEDGDDDMKRTIAKSMSEGRQKSEPM